MQLLLLPWSLALSLSVSGVCRSAQLAARLPRLSAASQHRTSPLVLSVVSPFDSSEPPSEAADAAADDAPAAAPTSEPAAGGDTGPLPLTEPNVEIVLETMRPYLIADGGNVALRSIEGGA